MLGRLKNLITALALVPLVLLTSTPVLAFDFSTNSCVDGAGKKISSPTCTDLANSGTTNPVSGPGGALSKAATVIAIVSAIGAIIMIMIGAFFYVTSGGNPENASKARARITAAFVGLVIIALAGLIVRFVTDNVIR